ncbi:MAG: hypothetical protein IPK99_08370 [Flavobacteriales bacterium]|nr:hypothetical protein [Flavobacteriales bacterium]
MLRAFKYAPVWIALFASCKKGDAVPAYLQLGAITVQTDPNLEGTNSASITDLWVFVNDKPAGVWEAGSRVPVLGSGAVEVKLIAGVRRNGFRDDRVQYPFYATWSGAVDLIELNTAIIAPTFSYFDNSIYWIEDFEGSGFKFSRSDDSDTTLNLVQGQDTVLGGTASGELFVTTDRPFVRMFTTDPFDIGALAFLELDYRSDHRLLIGVLYTPAGSTTTTDVPYLYLSPTLRTDGGMPWNKVYVDLSELMSVPGASNKRFYLQLDLNDGASSGRVYLDDLKLVHR